MSEPLLIPCPACNGLNRIPAERLGDAARCGRCKAEVLPARPFALSQASFAAQNKGDLPLDASLREASDAGRPLVVGNLDSEITRRFAEVAAAVAGTLGL